MTGAMLPSVHAMLPAMVILALPAFGVCVGFTVMAYRRRNKSAGE